MARDASDHSEHTNNLPEEKFDYEAFLNKNPGIGTIVDYASDRIVYAQGDPIDSLYYIISGAIKVSIFSEQGKEGVVAFLGPGSFFGEACLDFRPHRHATVATTSPSKIVRFRCDAIARVLADDPAFSRLFVRFLLGRTEKLEADLIDQLFHSSEKRLARILLTLANTGIDHEANAIPFPVNQEVLANMVGTTRSRISQFMNKFRKLGYVEYNDKIKVHNSLINVILNK